MSTRLANRRTTSSPSMTSCTTGPSPWSLKTRRLSTRTASCLSPCAWDVGHCYAEGLTYLLNITEPDYCPVAVVKEFLGHRLCANVSHSGNSYDSHQAEAVISAEVEEKIPDTTNRTGESVWTSGDRYQYRGHVFSSPYWRRTTKAVC